MDYRYYLERLWYKIIYGVLSVVYLVRLNMLNKRLLMYNFDSPVALLSYSDGVAIKFFAYAVILFGIGAFLEYAEYKWMKYDADDVRDVIVSVCTMIVLGILLILIIVFIDNPILRAVLMMVAVIVGVAGAMAS